jgi:large subunit ribosomal protein L28
MSKQCSACGKRKVVGGSITHRGIAKKKGGIGLQLVKTVKRTFKPNLQRVRVKVNGTVKRVTLCTACIRSGKAKKA